MTTKEAVFTATGKLASLKETSLKQATLFEDGNFFLREATLFVRGFSLCSGCRFARWSSS